ncbi:MAG: ice-binding family protein [Candidatus Cloacimonetes bacterium]|jgi:hypothetical protein|nr:ice-binding family protein [Candidatus Cloacimonadota bacterium]
MKHIVLIFAMVLLSTMLLYAVDPPINLEITHNGNTIHLEWNAVSGATGYAVWSRDTPYGSYTLDKTGTFLTDTHWKKTETATKRFYQVFPRRGPVPVDLGTAEDFVILANAGISTVPSSAITGNIGVSPASAAALTGFSETMHSSGTYSTCPQVVGKMYAADYNSPTPTMLGTAVGDMITAYNDAAGRITPDHLNLGSGNLNGLTLTPGLYKWGTGILLSSAVTISGGANDVWIFQVGEGITFDSGANVILSGGANPKNIIWQSAGVVALGTAAHLEGIVLSATAITLATGATVNGRLLAQTAVTLDQSVVTQPTP